MVEITDGAGRVLDVTQIQVVLEEVELKRALHDECAEEDDACEYFEIGRLTFVLEPTNVPV